MPRQNVQQDHLQDFNFHSHFYSMRWHAFIPLFRKGEQEQQRMRKREKKVNRARHSVSRLNAEILVLYEMWFKTRLIWKNFSHLPHPERERQTHSTLVYANAGKNDSHKVLSFSPSLSQCLFFPIRNRFHLFSSFVYRKIAISQQFNSKKLSISSSSALLYSVTSCFMTFQSLSLHCIEYIAMNSNRNWYGFWYFINIECALCDHGGMVRVSNGSEKPIIKFY